MQTKLLGWKRDSGGGKWTAQRKKWVECAYHTPPIVVIALFLRVGVGIGCVLVTSFAVMVCGRRVLLCFFVLPHLVMMTGLEVVVSSSLMVRCSLMMMVRCRVFLLVCHETVPMWARWRRQKARIRRKVARMHSPYQRFGNCRVHPSEGADVRRLTLREVNEDHGGILPPDATFRPDDEPARAGREAEAPNPLGAVRRAERLCGFRDRRRGLDGRGSESLADPVPGYERNRHRPRRTNGHRPPCGAIASWGSSRSRQVKREGDGSRRPPGPAERGAVDPPGVSDRHRVGAPGCALLGALSCTEPANRSAPIPEWDQCDADALRSGVADIETKCGIDRNEAGAPRGRWYSPNAFRPAGGMRPQPHPPARRSQKRFPPCRSRSSRPAHFRCPLTPNSWTWPASLTFEFGNAGNRFSSR